MINKSPLKHYFQENDISNSLAAKRLGITPVHLHRILKGTHYPSIDLARKIESYTDGVLRWYDLVKPEEKASKTKCEKKNDI